MRKKIAKRKRREALRKGAMILEEGREPEDNLFFAKVKYMGWKIFSGGEDELEVWNGVLACFPSCEEEPREES